MIPKGRIWRKHLKDKTHFVEATVKTNFDDVLEFSYGSL